MKVFFLLNASRSERFWDLREAAGAAARRRGATARFGQIDRKSPSSAERLLGQAIEEGYRRIVTVGGDGTMHSALNALRRLRQLPAVELGLVPAGTCNDFARGMALRPRRLADAFDTALGSRLMPTDLGLMRCGGDEYLFLNNAGFGRRGASAPRKVSAFQTLRRFQPIHLRARWEKGQIEGTFFMLLACNAPYFSKGLYFSKAACVNDGLLDIHLVPAMPRWRLMPMLLKGRLRRPVGNRQVLTLRVQKLEVETDRDVWPQADGEPPPRAVREITFGIAPEKVMILVPERNATLWKPSL